MSHDITPQQWSQEIIQELPVLEQSLQAIGSLAEQMPLDEETDAVNRPRLIFSTLHMVLEMGMAMHGEASAGRSFFSVFFRALSYCDTVSRSDTRQIVESINKMIADVRKASEGLQDQETPRRKDLLSYAPLKLFLENLPESLKGEDEQGFLKDFHWYLEVILYRRGSETENLAAMIVNQFEETIDEQRERMYCCRLGLDEVGLNPQEQAQSGREDGLQNRYEQPIFARVMHSSKVKTATPTVGINPVGPILDVIDELFTDEPLDSPTTPRITVVQLPFGIGRSGTSRMLAAKLARDFFSEGEGFMSVIIEGESSNIVSSGKMLSYLNFLESCRRPENKHWTPLLIFNSWDAGQNDETMESVLYPLSMLLSGMMNGNTIENLHILIFTPSMGKEHLENSEFAQLFREPGNQAGLLLPYFSNDDPERYDLVVLEAEQANVYEGNDFSELNLQEAVFQEKNFFDSDLSGSALNKVVFDSCLLMNSDFAGAMMEDITFKRCNMSKSDLSGSYMESAKFINLAVDKTDLSNCMLNGGVFFEAEFRETDFAGSLMSNSDWVGVAARGCDLSEVLLSDSNFEGVDFSNADLSGAEFTNSTFQDVKFTGADVEGTLFIDTVGLHGNTVNSLKKRGAIFEENDDLRQEFLDLMSLNETKND